MDDRTARAKELFFSYACNRFFMVREGVEDEYRQYGIGEGQEAEWRKEYIALWVGQLSVDDMKALNQLGYAWAGEALPELIDMSDKGDSYAKLWYANAIYDLALGAELSPERRQEGVKVAIELWRSVVNGPIQLTESHRAVIRPSMQYLSASTPEEYVLNYAKSKLSQAKEKGY